MSNLVNLNAIWAELLTQAPGLVVALCVLGGLYRLLNKYGDTFIKTQQSMAESMGAQAQAMTSLTGSMQGFITRDNGDHQEMMIILKLMEADTKGIKRRLNELDDIKNSLGGLDDLADRLETLTSSTPGKEAKVGP